MKIETLHQLYVEQLKDLYSAEKQLIKALPKMAKAAASSGLKSAFESHLKETEEQFRKIELLFEDLEYTPGGQKCEAMAGLIQEGEEVIKDQSAGPVRDAALIAAAQRVEHYEIAGYGTVCEYAKILDRKGDRAVLESILEQEKAANEKLNEIALSEVNESAKAAAA